MGNQELIQKENQGINEYMGAVNYHLVAQGEKLIHHNRFWAMEGKNENH